MQRSLFPRPSLSRKGFGLSFLLGGLAVLSFGAMPVLAVPRPAVEVPPAVGLLPIEATVAVSNDGWEFTPSFNIVVTALGYFDQGDDGLVGPHQAAIFDVSTQALVTPVVTITSDDPLVSRFRYESIPPVTLQAGRSYIVDGTLNGPPIDQFTDGAPAAYLFQPEIGYVAYRYTYDGALTFPDLSSAGNLYLGPNFQFDNEQAIPVTATTWGRIKSLLAQ